MALEEKPISFLKGNITPTEFDKRLSKITEQQAKELVKEILDGDKDRWRQVEMSYDYKSPQQKKREEENMNVVCEKIR